MNSLAFIGSRLFSLRLLIVVLALACVFVGDALPLLGWLDRVLFSALGNPEGIGDAVRVVDMTPDAFAIALQARGLVEPEWSALAIRAGLMMSTLILVLAVPRMGGAVALPVLLLIAGALVVLQAAFMFYQSAWLPLGEVVTLLMVGYVIMLFWLQPRRDIVALSENVRVARTRLGRLLLQQGQPEEALETIEAQAAKVGAPLLVHGQHWHVQAERGRLIYSDESGLRDLPPPVLIGDHQFENAGSAIAALRFLGLGDAAYEAAMTGAVWPARMQRLTTGPLPEVAPEAELWLDGGHNPSAGEALAKVLAALPARPTHLICGMLNTKDVTGYLRPLAAHAEGLWAVSIPGEANTLPASETAEKAVAVGLTARTADTVAAALGAIVAEDPHARVLICGSLYLAGTVLRENG